MKKLLAVNSGFDASHVKQAHGSPQTPGLGMVGSVASYEVILWARETIPGYF